MPTCQSLTLFTTFMFLIFTMTVLCVETWMVVKNEKFDCEVHNVNMEGEYWFQLCDLLINSACGISVWNDN